jgi:hypothetical protein
LHFLAGLLVLLCSLYTLGHAFKDIDVLHQQCSSRKACSEKPCCEAPCVIAIYKQGSYYKLPTCCALILLCGNNGFSRQKCLRLEGHFNT